MKRHHRYTWGILLATGAVAAGLLASAATSSAVTSTTPPFGQCPAIGAAPSCDILLVVNTNNTVSVYGDTTVGPYDGGDDTLVGIVNDSAAAVPAVTVTGAGSGLGGLDGDGLCTYAFTGSSGCPFGPTGYEGPGTSLVTNSAFPDSAEVDFTGGLAPHASAYFSLEGALTSASLTARPGPLLGRYVAIGDSYSAGEGNPPFLNGTDVKKGDQCHRSNAAYGPLTKKALGISDSDFTFAACSGAIIPDLTNSFKNATTQYNEGAQLNAIAPSNSPSTTTGLVTLSIGGNDAKFSTVLGHCVSGFFNGNGHAQCQNGINANLGEAEKLFAHGGQILLNIDDNSFSNCDAQCAQLYTILDQRIAGYPYKVVKVPSLEQLFEQIHTRAPNAEIRVLLYPRFFPNSPVARCVVGTTRILHHTTNYSLDAWEMNKLNAGADALDAAISAQVTAAANAGLNIRVFDPRSDFTDGHHEICDNGNSVAASDSSRWFNALILNGTSTNSGSFHPNAGGQADFTRVLRASL